LTKDGRIVDVYLTATALIDEAGEVYAIATTERQIGRTQKEKKQVGKKS
jgi:two-component system, chemotaxis family, CheB/CheR fusion protein